MQRGKETGSPAIRIAKALLFCVLAAVLFGVPLFLSAGSLRFTGAWLFLAVFCLSVFVMFTYLAIKDPSLFEKRMKVEEEDQSQTIIKVSLTLIYLVELVVSGLDYRFRRSSVPLLVVVVFAAVVALGAVMLFFVMKQNTYGSRAVEIQGNQRVIDTELAFREATPYAHRGRHPGTGVLPHHHRLIRSGGVQRMLTLAAVEPRSSTAGTR